MYVPVGFLCLFVSFLCLFVWLAFLWSHSILWSRGLVGFDKESPPSLYLQIVTPVPLPL